MTTQIAFYHLIQSDLETALPKLLEKTLSAGKRAVVQVGVEARVEPLNNHLWAYSREGWLPHGSAKDGEAEEQPVWLTTTDENPNGASFLFLTDGASSENIGNYERCFDLFDGRDEQAVQAARSRWKVYKDEGHDLTYWQQNDHGRWEQKA